MRKSTEEIANEMDRAASFEEVKEIIRQNNIGRETFGDRLLELCAEYDKTPGELLKDLTISKSQFYAVLNGKRRPSRVAVIKMVLTLGVNLAEADELLKLAGYKELTTVGTHGGSLVNKASLEACSRESSHFSDERFKQVAYYLGSKETIEREFGAFKPISDASPKYVFSLDRFDYSRDGIAHVNIVDFLLGKVDINIS